MIYGITVALIIISIILLTLSQFVYVTLKIDRTLSVSLDIVFLSVIFTRTKTKNKKRKPKKKEKKPSPPLISIPSFLNKCDLLVERLVIPTLPYPFLYPILFGVTTGSLSTFLSYLSNNSRSFALGEGFLDFDKDDRLQLDITARILLLDFLLLVIKRKKKRKVKSIVGIKNE